LTAALELDRGFEALEVKLELTILVIASAAFLAFEALEVLTGTVTVTLSAEVSEL
jgi:hypothetical protein